MAERILVLGGTRSGKSRVAEDIVASSGAPAVHYVATGTAGDAEMAERIARHRSRRPSGWTTAETCDVTTALAGAPADAAVLVDSLGGWVTARMSAHGLWGTDDLDTAALAPTPAVAPLGEAGEAALTALIDEAAALWATAAGHPRGPVVVVAEETGLGVTPADPFTRRWVDVVGAVVQRLASDADRVLLVVAGRVLELPSGRAGRGAVVPDGVGLRAHGDTMVPAGALDLAVNVQPGPPVHLLPVLAAVDPSAYPDQAPAAAALAERHGRPVAEVLPTAGAAEAFWLLAAVSGARRAAVVHPSFTEPEAALRAAGIPVTHVQRRAGDGWALDPAAVPDDADLVVVGNPNNPTGALDPPGAVAALCRPGRTVVVDEAFMDFVEDPEAGLAARRDLPGLVVTRSITKLWGLAGVRAGYLLAAPEVVARCRGARQPWSVGSHALAVLTAVAGDERHRRQVAAEVADARADLVRRLRAVPGVTVWEGAANFVLARVPSAPGGPATHAALLRRGIAVRPSTFPGLDAHHLRITVRGASAHRRLAAALREVLETDAEVPSGPSDRYPYPTAEKGP